MTRRKGRSVLVRLASLRLPVLLVVLAAAALALAIGYGVMSRVTHAQEVRNAREENLAVAGVLAEEAAKTDGFSEISGSAALLLREEHQRAVITLGSVRHVFGAPLPANRQVVAATSKAQDATVVVSSPIDSPASMPLTFVVLGSGVLVVVLGSAVLANAVSNREVRRRAELAVAAADQVAAGDFSARVGSDGPDVLAAFGRAFDAMAARLEEAEKDQRVFLADLAHEIGTPLNAIAGFAMAVVDGTIPPEKARGPIAAQTARVTELLDDLTQLRAIDAGDEEGQSEVDLGSIATELVAAYEPIAAEAGVRLSVRPKRVMVRLAPRLLDTVLRNLISNAIRYTPDGGTVEVGCYQDVARDAVVYVKDSGIGIAVEHQAKVFDRFYRVDEARDRESGGSGLGLAIAKRSAEAIGGHLELDSSPGRGSEFRFVLPRALQEAQRNRTSLDEELPATGSQLAGRN